MQYAFQIPPTETLPDTLFHPPSDPRAFVLPLLTHLLKLVGGTQVASSLAFVLHQSQDSLCWTDDNDQLRLSQVCWHDGARTTPSRSLNLTQQQPSSSPASEEWNPASTSILLECDLSSQPSGPRRCAAPPHSARPLSWLPRWQSPPCGAPSPCTFLATSGTSRRPRTRRRRRSSMTWCAPHRTHSA
jgi:hypothetical protein